ncbi:hypothetical protein Taro_011097 [Colocasia esculenta]|uniref:IBH1-like N-terminal domain-containing protein n=1 Tax=Colocasia esculenta TaxID=4460 RepID=A0A843U8Y1_COLES|nr:hypothetical protein [Colocasia esculenta]
MQASRFLRALARIQWGRGARHASPSRRSTVMCGRRIRRAAYASMALAAGPRRVWSRAVLRSLRRPPGATTLANRRLQTTFCRKIKPRKHIGGNQEDALRQLVPGGGRMDFCSLLEETGNYIQCLRAQVLLMKRVADSMSG